MYQKLFEERDMDRINKWHVAFNLEDGALTVINAAEHQPDGWYEVMEAPTEQMARIYLSYLNSLTPVLELPDPVAAYRHAALTLAEFMADYESGARDEMYDVLTADTSWL